MAISLNSLAREEWVNPTPPLNETPFDSESVGIPLQQYFLEAPHNGAGPLASGVGLGDRQISRIDTQTVMVKSEFG